MDHFYLEKLDIRKQKNLHDRKFWKITIEWVEIEKDSTLNSYTISGRFFLHFYTYISCREDCRRIPWMSACFEIRILCSSYREINFSAVTLKIFVRFSRIRIFTKFDGYLKFMNLKNAFLTQ